MAHWGHRGGTRVLLLGAATVALLIPTPVEAATGCATPGRDGSATITGVINTYFPASASAGSGSTSIPLGAATGASAPIAVGGLVLVIQMQDAAIDSTN